MSNKSPISPEFSVVMPCLNEERTIAVCINKAKSSLKSLNLNYEIIIADNGSNDKSVKIAKGLGVTVISVAEKGYGAALQEGIKQSSGKYIIMGDSDDSYDFLKLEPFVKNLRGGFDFVIGDRFRGEIKSGAMPILHRLIGNPLFSFLGRLLFGSKVRDFYCGFRGFSKDLWKKMDLQSTGMEYAIEMVIKSTLIGAKIKQVPIILHKDGRIRHSHLQTWKDGWRTLLFILIYAPTWLFLIPGFTLLTISTVLFFLAVSQSFSFLGVRLDIHTLLVSSTFIFVGLQVVLLGIFTKVFIAKFNLLPNRGVRSFSINRDNLAYIVLLSILLSIVGACLLSVVLFSWYKSGFGDLDYRTTMRVIIPAVLLILLGAQLFFNSFFFGVLLIPRKK